jgi:4-amino-4-deoxy-L-arabinose transferase-like glycosyltransferase
VSAWRPPDRAARLAAPALALAGLAFLAAVTLSTISAPGLQYDEALFVNAALGGDHPHQGFIEDEVGGVPTLLMPYIGALKAWLYFPVFELFGVSPGTVRAPMVAAALAAVALVALLAWRLFGAWAAAGVALLLATDPAFATMTKADWGPVALSALLRAGALLAFFSWVRTGRARWAWALVACLSLGLFNKLDFALFAAGLGSPRSWCTRGPCSATCVPRRCPTRSRGRRSRRCSWRSGCSSRGRPASSTWEPRRCRRASGSSSCGRS